MEMIAENCMGQRRWALTVTGQLKMVAKYHSLIEYITCSSLAFLDGATTLRTGLAAQMVLPIRNTNQIQ